MNISKLFEKSEEKEYITFPTTLETYAWYKPILILFITVIISLAISGALLTIIAKGHTTDTIIQLIYTTITVIAMIPGIYIGTRLIYKIPFSTQIAPVRKWNWGIYIKTFIITLIVYGAVMSYPVLTSGTISNNPSIAVILLCIIIPIFQGFAEEYLCRGLLMQTFGSWFKIPIVAIIIQALIFALMHHYNLYALISVLCTGLLYGLITWYGQGLEASSAMHSANNIFTFLLIGFSIQQEVGGNANVHTLLLNILLMTIPIIILLVLDKKFNLFGAKN